MPKGKAEEKVEYGLGVQQGNNMTTLLFLFVMQAAIETFESLKNQTKLKIGHHPFSTDPSKQKGRSQGQATKWQDDVGNILYVVNSAFTHPTREDVEKGAQQLLTT